jgi:hypothetical protein
VLVLDVLRLMLERLGIISVLLQEPLSEGELRGLSYLLNARRIFGGLAGSFTGRHER